MTAGMAESGLGRQKIISTSFTMLSFSPTMREGGADFTLANSKCITSVDERLQRQHGESRDRIIENTE